ncbi:LicD family protein [Saccharicrinis sp. 156]|uniref:LicD family protein n=1 Tax=Saccharicrinis sp. 156 TaxID=3417574 RepID=UPI003D330D98
MKGSNIGKLQKIDLEIVKEVVSICKENNLKYYMIGGTLLGAIRHKGFIPWDDDIDLGMPRDDYEKFLEVATSKLSSHLDIVNYKTDSSYQYYITRVRNKSTKVIETRIGNDTKYTNASIDIFPLDGTPNNKYLRKFYYLKIMTLRALMSLSYKDSIDHARRRGFLERIFLSIMMRIPTEKLFNPTKIKSLIDKEMRKYPVAESDIIGCLMGAYRVGEMVPRKIYGKGKCYDFEDIKLHGPEYAHDFLQIIYGNYMVLPPESARKTHFKIVEINGEKIDS